MKQYFKVAIPMAMVALFLSAWSLPAWAASRAIPMNGLVTKTRSSLNVSAVRHSSFRCSSVERRVHSNDSCLDQRHVGSGLGTLTEHWNGPKWSLVNSRSPGSEYNALNGVAAGVSNDIWAVGSYSINALPHQ